jgi:hypothetical protein
MKNLTITLIALITSANVFAAQMTQTEINDYIVDTAKELRRDLWVAGHEEVGSWHEKATLELINDHVKQENMQHYEDALDREQISDIYRCFHRKGCEVHFIGTSSEYWGGYGQEAHFVLLNTKDRYHHTISHVVYAE